MCHLNQSALNYEIIKNAFKSGKVRSRLTGLSKMVGQTEGTLGRWLSTAASSARRRVGGGVSFLKVLITNLPFILLANTVPEY